MSQNAVAIGLKNLYLGPIEADGGMSQSLTLLGNAVEGTPVLTFEEGERTDFNIEQSNDPFYSQVTPGNKVFTLSIYDVTPAKMFQFFGGSLVVGAGTGNPDVWEAPALFPDLEQSVLAEHMNGGYLEIPRAKISALAQWNFQKNLLPQLDLNITVLTPTKVDEPPLRFTQGVYTP